MSLASHLANIKSSGIYRFVWDKSELPPQTAQTLRMVVGYSEKGVFNTPVYIDKASDFTTIYGNTSKRLERRGVYFHRLAQQALAKGPILALNLKPFSEEKVSAVSFAPSQLCMQTASGDTPTAAYAGSLGVASEPNVDVTSVYNTNRFWTLDPDTLPLTLTNQKEGTAKFGKNLMYLTATDTKASSCSVFVRPVRPKQFDLTIREWYANETSAEMPEYLIPIMDTKLCDYFLEVYVFRGEFTNDICKQGGPLGNYINKDLFDRAVKTRSETWGAAAPAKLAEMGVNEGADEQETVWNGYFRVKGHKLSADEEATIKPLALMPGEIDTDVIAPVDPEVFLNPFYVNAFGELTDPLQALANDSASNYVGHYVGCILPYFKDGNDNYISLDLVFNADYNAHKMMMKIDEKILEQASDDISIEKILTFKDKTKVTSVVTGVDENGDPVTSKVSEDTQDNLYRYDENGHYLDNYDASAYAWVPNYFEGYEYVTIDSSMTGKQLQSAAFQVLKYKGIREAMTNRVDVDYHYIVDTFDSYLGLGVKSELASLAKEKDNAFAILNFPKMSAFVDPDEDNNGGAVMRAKFRTALGAEFGGDVFDIKKIAEPKNGFSLVSEVNGASWCGYFSQLVISDGTVKTVFPSAALVSNNFMDKWGPRQPYYIVAGPNYGRMSWDGLVGPDYAFSRTDLDVLEPMGVNAIVYVPRKGTYINSNQTAKQVPVSALSKIHIRELVIYLQDEIEAMLEGYHWELNTQALRDVIKAKADSILETVQNNGGIYKFENTCDESNNTPEVIDNEMLVLWTSIEPARGAGKMVQELTIHRTGGMSSSTR